METTPLWKVLCISIATFFVVFSLSMICYTVRLVSSFCVLLTDRSLPSFNYFLPSIIIRMRYAYPTCGINTSLQSLNATRNRHHVYDSLTRSYRLHSTMTIRAVSEVHARSVKR